jgi:hypothetical protein
MKTNPYIFYILAGCLIVYITYRYYRSDCEVSDWSEWTKCSAECGGGTRQRTRSITKYKNLDGKKCPALMEIEPCNTQECPVNCEVSEWSNWSTCNTSCGGGIQQKTRTINVTNMYGGKECPSLTETQTCNTQNCPIDCQVSDWSEWSMCNASCGNGTQIKTRTINVTNMYGGKACPSLVETQMCKIKDCPIDCQVSDWSEWSMCNASCGNGTQIKTRTINVTNMYGGKVCPPLVETQMCKIKDCPIDCQVSDWSEWSMCNASCGNGTQIKTRTINVTNMYGGKVCPALVETQMCKIKDCPIDCVGKWLDTTGSQCNVNATQSSIRTQYYSIEVEAKYGGVSCSEVSGKIKTIDCPVNCYGEWKNIGECEIDDCKQSFDGLQTQNYKVITNELPGGTCVNRNQARRIKCSNYGCLESYFTNWKYSEKEVTPGFNITTIQTYRIMEKGTLTLNNETEVKYTWYIKPLLSADVRFNTLSLSYNKLKNTLSYVFYAPRNDNTFQGTLSRDFDKSKISFTRVLNDGVNKDTTFTIEYDPIHCKGRWENINTCNVTCRNNLIEYSQNTQRFIIDVNATYGGDPCQYQNNTTMVRQCSVICPPKAFTSDVYYLRLIDISPGYEYLKATVLSTTENDNFVKKKYNTPNSAFKTLTKIFNKSSGKVTYEYETSDNYTNNIYVTIDMSKAESEGKVNSRNSLGATDYNDFVNIKWDV